MSGPGPSPGPADRLADRLPQVLAPVLGPGLSVGRVEPLSGGASRQTWGILVHGGDGRPHELVLRTGRPDLNVGLELEAASLRAAAAAGMPVPAVLRASDDTGALGCQYLISARVPGEAIPRRVLRALRAEHAERGGDAGRSAAGDARGRLLAQCAAALAALHSADPDGVPGLAADDPLVLWRERTDATGQPSAVFEITLRWLLRHRPPPGGTAIVHGDFRLGNLIVDESGLAAVLDWELVHRGDPLEDLGWFCVRAWRFGEDARPAGGLGSVEEFVASYERAAGTHVDRDAVRWWQVLGTLRWGMICQHQAHRHLSGQTRSVELAAIGRRACENEWDLLELLAEGNHGRTGGPGADRPASRSLASDDQVSDHPAFGHPVYGRPTLGELVAALRESLADAAAGRGPALGGYDARVAANVLAIVERELARGAADQQAYADLLARLGAADEAALAAEIRAGRRDHQLAEIAAGFRDVVAARLAVAHPGYASPPGGDNHATRLPSRHCAPSRTDPQRRCPAWNNGAMSVPPPAEPRRSFDAAAEIYHGIRPSYPPPVFDELFRLLPSQPVVLEVGPGTGKATGDLLSRGANVTAVEIGPAMAAKLREVHPSPALTVIVGDFEEIDLEEHGFDAVFSATAYHWISAKAQADRPASVLRHGGVVAIVDINQVSSPEDRGFFVAAQPIYQRYGEGHTGPPAPERDAVDPPMHRVLRDDGRFSNVEVRAYDWDQTYSAAGYRQLMLSFSSTQMMTPPARQGLLNDIEDFIRQRYDNQVTRPIVVTLTTARLS